MTQSDPRFSEAMAGKVGHESEITQKSSPEKHQGQGLIQGILTEREEGSVWLPSIVLTSLDYPLLILKTLFPYFIKQASSCGGNLYLAFPVI